MSRANAGVTVDAAVPIPMDRLADFCARWGIEVVELYGSVVSGKFGSTDPIEVMATFAPDARPSLFNWGAMEEELSAIFGRRATLATRRAAESNAYPEDHRRMRESARVIYAR